MFMGTSLSLQGMNPDSSFSLLSVQIPPTVNKTAKQRPYFLWGGSEVSSGSSSHAHPGASASAGCVSHSTFYSACFPLFVIRYICVKVLYEVFQCRSSFPFIT